ncbi:MAG: hypothetical protein RIC55_04765 [Pirellulaceae bacterium]
MCRIRTDARPVRRRRGLSLIELLMASSVMVLVAGTLGTLAMTAQTTAEYGHGHDLATQHARVCLERIERTLNAANASEQFPGFLAIGDTSGAWYFPDTLVVWRPESEAVDPEGLPRFNELVIFCADPNLPSQLVEITVPDDAGVAYAAADTGSWQTALASIKADGDAERVVLTDLLRTATADDGVERACVRFHLLVRPTAAQWTEYKTGAISWDEVDWVQDMYGTTTGMRQAWCRFELQLLPRGIDGKEVSDELTMPFFGSGAVYDELYK